MKELEEFYKDYKDEKMKEVNFLYFETLYEKYSDDKNIEIKLFDGGNDSKVIPLPFLAQKDYKYISIQDYETLPHPNNDVLKNFGLCICKMQAGLGTSVKRDDLVGKYTKREKLGSKGTDLFIKYRNRVLSIAEVQLLKAEETMKKKDFNYVSFLNLVNSETEEAVLEIWDHKHIDIDKKYDEVFNTKNLRREPEIYQLMMPTIGIRDEITFERVAPAGHAFLGFFEILKIYRKSDIQNEILVIGNGEDLKSTPDNKILSWVAIQNIPIVMITTTKLEKDKKGGQIAVVKEALPYVTIVEKAQAEKASQLELFEELGLNKDGERSLFNTNIVIINKKALKSLFDKYLKLNESEFLRIISPDLIKNIKVQDEKEFIQLEGAIGSTILNLDKYFRLNFDVQLISYLNLAPESRERFFMPIKKRSDFDEIYS